MFPRNLKHAEIKFPLEYLIKWPVSADVIWLKTYKNRHFILQVCLPAANFDKSIFFLSNLLRCLCNLQHCTLTYSWTPETKLSIISEAEACPISTQHVNSEVRAMHACLNMTVIVSALLALKPITAGNTSPVCQLQKLWEAIVSAQRHNCKLLADARVADSAAPIWIAPLSGITSENQVQTQRLKNITTCRVFVSARTIWQSRSQLFVFNIIYNILQKNIFILISKQFKCPSTSVQTPWAEKLMWVLTLESQSSDFSWEKLQTHSGEY